MRKNELVGPLNCGLNYYIYRNYHINELKVLLLNKTGSRDEKAEQNGIAHLLEHMCLAYDMFDSRDIFMFKHNIINPKAYNFSGYTDFDRIILRIQTEDKCETLENMLYILEKIISGDILNKNVLAKVKEDVIYECEYYDRKSIMQNKIVSFITENEIIKIPRGKSSIINNITIDDLLRFHSENFILNKLGIIIIGNIDIFEAKNKLVQIFDRNITISHFRTETIYKKYANTNIIKIHDYYNEYVTVKVFYKLLFKNCTVKKRLIKYFFDRMLENYILYEFDLSNLKLLDIQCIDKTKVGSSDYYMIIYKINSTVETYNLYLHIINKLFTNRFSIEEYKSEAYKLKDMLIKIHDPNIYMGTNSIVKEYIQNFFDDQVIFDIKEDYEELTATIDKITIDDINSLIHPILNNNFKFVIQNKEYSEFNKRIIKID